MRAVCDGHRRIPADRVWQSSAGCVLLWSLGSVSPSRRAHDQVQLRVRGQLREGVREPIDIPTVINHHTSTHITAQKQVESHCAAVGLSADAVEEEGGLVADRRIDAATVAALLSSRPLAHEKAKSVATSRIR